MGRCQQCCIQQDNSQDDNPPNQPTPRRSVLSSAGSNIADRPRDTSTSDNKLISACPPMSLRQVYKILNQINHLSKNDKNLYTQSNHYNTLTAPRYSRVVECCVDIKIEKLGLKTPQNSLLEVIQHGWYTFSVVIAKQKEQSQNMGSSSHQ